MAMLPIESLTNFAADTTSGWGSDEFGRAWTVSVPTASTKIYKSGGVGVFDVVAGHGNMYARLNVPDRSDYEVLSLSEHNTTNLVTHGPMIGMSATTRGYAARVTNRRFSIVAANSWGEVTEMNGVDIPQMDANRKIWIRLKYDQGAGQIRARWWYHGTAEPTAWGISSYVGSYPITGKVGYYAINIDHSYKVKVHALYVLRAGHTEVSSVPLTANFNIHRSGGWGKSTQNHVWRGHANEDPEYYAQTAGNVFLDGSQARYDAVSGNVRLFATNAKAANSRITAKFSVGGSNAQPVVYIGLRGTLGSSGGSLTYTGYEAAVMMGSNLVVIYKKTSLTGALTKVGQFTAPFYFAKGTKYAIDFQANGKQLAVKVWNANQSEPSGYNYAVADSSIGVTGVPFVRAHPNGSANTPFYFDEVLVQATRTVTVSNDPLPPPPDPKADQPIAGSLSASNVTDRGVTLKTTWTGDANNNTKVLFYVRPRGTSKWILHPVTSYSRTANTKGAVCVIEGLVEGTAYEAHSALTDVNGVNGGNIRNATFTTTYNAVRPAALELEATQSRITVQAPYVGDMNGNATARCTVRRESATGPIVINNVLMTAARTQKFFLLEAGGMLPDYDHHVSVTFTDPDGFFGSATQTGIVRTLGQAVELESVSVKATMTTAMILVKYLYDTNDNSSVAIQYRRTGTTLWTTIPESNISVDRTAKTFHTNITGLALNNSYEVLVTISDPNGTSGVRPSTIKRTFSTIGVRSEAERSGKKYVYRVYNPDGKFVGAWGDGPEPQFSLEENGGVTNLSITLPRTFSQIEKDPTIGFTNRVDVWCIDGEAQGMGRNLLSDPHFSRGAWLFPTPWRSAVNVGADGLDGLFLNNATTGSYVMSEHVELPYVVPLILTAHAKCRGGKIRIDIEAFDQYHQSILVSEGNAETVSNDWQKIVLEWLPPPTTKYVRVRVSAVGKSTAQVSHVQLLSKEMLIYRGTIESYEPQLDTEGERVEIDILGLTSYLTDDYIEFLQWVNVQPIKDSIEKRKKKPPTDPSNMIKDIIDLARKQNPKFPIFYTTESIKMTGETASYTLRDVMIRDCLDRVRSISPPNWHWFVDQIGCLHFRGPEHTVTHRLTIGVEILEYRNPRTIRNLKNHIKFKGRQDSDFSEKDGYGTITAEVFDTGSIKKYGLRTAKFQDANITDPDTAMIYASGKLEELSQVEEAGVVKVPDEKDTRLSLTSLRGYNVQSLQPGDYVEVRDPENGPYKTYWDQFNWDEGVWDTTVSKVVSMAVPVKVISYRGDHVVLELSHRRPSANGDFAKMSQRMRALQAKEANGDY